MKRDGASDAQQEQDIQTVREDLWLAVYEEQAEQACIDHDEDSSSLQIHVKSTGRKQR